MELIAAAVFGGLGTWYANREVPASEALVVSHAGRDQELIRLLKGAQRSVYLRTECLNLVPAGNELLQAIHRKVAVKVDLPLRSGFFGETSRLPQLLIGLGAVVTFRSDPASNDQGTYLVIDGRRFLYSATPLTLSAPGSQVSYVTGPIMR